MSSLEAGKRNLTNYIEIFFYVTIFTLAEFPPRLFKSIYSGGRSLLELVVNSLRTLRRDKVPILISEVSRAHRAYDSIACRSLVTGTSYSQRSLISKEHGTEDGDRRPFRQRSLGSDELPSPEDDPDVFGTLSIGSSGLAVKDKVGMAVNAHIRELASDVDSVFSPEEADDHAFRPAHPWTMDRLRRTVFELLRQNKLTLALDTFMEVLQDGGFPMNQKDISFICSALISACARAGNVEMAFLLFDKMKQRGAGIKEGWYTSLFNACANSPWDSEKNLLRIEKTRSHMKYKGYEPNQAHYHALIKAYGRCGSLQQAFAVVDEIRERTSQSSKTGLHVMTETFNFLLQACITDRENGYRHAVVTWQKMLKMKVKPDCYTYKLLLRAIRECSIELPKEKSRKPTPKLRESSSNNDGRELRSGPPEVIDPVPGSLKENVGVIDLLLRDAEDSVRVDAKEQFPLVERSNSNLQDLLNVKENRFALLGGLRAFTIQMDIHRVKLDVTIATELVQNVSTKEVPDVLMLLKSGKQTPDIHFFNMMMMKYVQWRQVDKAKNVLELLATYNLTPNIMTWGILALGANTWSDCASLLREMDALGITPNDHILNSFLNNATKFYDPRYIIRLLEVHVRREIKPSRQFVNAVIKFQGQAHKAIVDVECGREVKPRIEQAIQSAEFTEYWQKLQLRFDGWVAEVGVKEETPIPWKENTRERVGRLKSRKLLPSIER